MLSPKQPTMTSASSDTPATAPTPTAEAKDVPAPGNAENESLTTVLTSKPQAKGEFFSLHEVKSKDGSDPADDPEWQRLWLATLRRPWNSLAIVPSWNNAPMVRMAHVLAAVGQRHLDRSIVVIDATDLQLDELSYVMDQMKTYKESGQSVLIALGLIAKKPPCLSVAQAADACLLCLQMGSSTFKDANRIIDDIGREQFVGSFALRREKKRS